MLRVGLRTISKPVPSTEAKATITALSSPENLVLETSEDFAAICLGAAELLVFPQSALEQSLKAVCWPWPPWPPWASWPCSCRGLPELCGVEDAEERVKAAIESHCEETFSRSHGRNSRDRAYRVDPEVTVAVRGF